MGKLFNGLLVPACKFFVQGKCTKGKDCRYNHQGDGLTGATFINRSSALQEPLTEPSTECDVAVSATGGASTALVKVVLHPGIEVSLGAGLAPENVAILCNSAAMSFVDKTSTGLEVTWYQTTRNVWLHFTAANRAETAIAILSEHKLHGVYVKASMKATHRPSLWCAQLSSVVQGIGEHDVIELLTNDAKPKRVILGDLSYDPLTASLQAIRNKTATISDRQTERDSIIPSLSTLKRKTFIEFDGVSSLSSLAADMNGTVITELGGSKVYADESLKIMVRLNRKMYVSSAETLKNARMQIWNDYKVQIKFTDVEPRGTIRCLRLLFISNSEAADVRM